MLEDNVLPVPVTTVARAMTIMASTTRNLNEDSRCHGRALNLATPERESEESQYQPTCTVSCEHYRREQVYVTYEGENL